MCSSLLASATQGALSTMPAVKSFALYAALAVLVDFVLQMTAFVALLSLDARRQDNNRCELFCCVKVSTKRPNKPNEGFLLPFMRKYYAPVLLNRYTRIIVVKLPLKSSEINTNSGSNKNGCCNWTILPCVPFRCWFLSSYSADPYSSCFM